MTTPPSSVGRQSRRVSREVARWLRWLHIYLSLFAFASLLFFAVTGITLNHPLWFSSGEPAVTEQSGDLPEQLAARVRHSPASASGASVSVPQLEIVEWLRAEQRITARLKEFRSDDSECLVSFAGPGGSTDVVLDRSSGHYQLTQTAHGWIAVINDLHKGRDSGTSWSWVIDVSAVLMIVVSLTGLLLLLYLQRHLLTGTLTAMAGTLVLVAIWWLFV